MSNQVLVSQITQPLQRTGNVAAAANTTDQPDPVLATTQNIPKFSERSHEQAKQSGSDKGKAVDDAISNLNDYAQNLKRQLHFSVDEASGRTVIKVTDPETDEIIRQIPPDEVLRIAESLEEQSGLLLSAQV